MATTRRIAIVLSKHLGKGQVGNVAAILMGQAALMEPDIFAPDAVLDLDGQRHAGIKHSTIVLEASSPTQLGNFLRRTQREHPELKCIAFTRVGLGLHDAFPAYRERVAASTTEALQPVGVLVVGCGDRVRIATKKFSLLD